MSRLALIALLLALLAAPLGAAPQQPGDAIRPAPPSALVVAGDAGEITLTWTQRSDATRTVVSSRGQLLGLVDGPGPVSHQITVSANVLLGGPVRLSEWWYSEERGWWHTRSYTLPINPVYLPLVAAS